MNVYISMITKKEEENEKSGVFQTLAPTGAGGCGKKCPFRAVFARGLHTPHVNTKCFLLSSLSSSSLVNNTSCHFSTHYHFIKETNHSESSMGSASSTIHAVFGGKDNNRLDRNDFVWSYTIGSGAFSKVSSVNHIGKQDIFQ
mgnify:CR=1 FL=1